MGKIYYSKRIQSTIKKGKTYMGKVWGKPGTSFESQRMGLIPLATYKNICEMLPTREVR